MPIKPREMERLILADGWITTFPKEPKIVSESRQGLSNYTTYQDELCFL